MSEKLHSHGEHLEPRLDLSKESLKNLERLREKAAEQQPTNPDKIAELQKNVEKQTISAKEVTIGEREEHSKTPGYVQKDLKQVAYARQLKHVRSRLNVPDRLLSRIIHVPAVEVISNVGGKTIARPSGILAGGICALVGSSIALYLAKHYGYSYNYLFVLILFGGGFALGLLIELLARLLSRKPRI